MSGPSSEVDRVVLEALEVPRSIGDLLRTKLRAAGWNDVEAAIASLSKAELISPIEDGRWLRTDSGTAWLSDFGTWEVRCDLVDRVAEEYFRVRGVVEHGVVVPGDRWTNGRGVAGVVADIESWDVESRVVSMRAQAIESLTAPVVLRRWEIIEPGGGATDSLLAPPDIDETESNTATTIAARGNLNAEQHHALVGLAASRVIGELKPAEAIGFASTLLADGADGPELMALAILPADSKALRQHDVEILFDDLCAAEGVELPKKGEAGWARARWLAQAIIDGKLAPGRGASQITDLWNHCGLAPGSEPATMPVLFEEWEETVGPQLDDAERRIIEGAHSVIRESDRAIEAMKLPKSFQAGTIRAIDVMPLLLEACPSFLYVWFDIEHENRDAKSVGGRLCYGDAAEFARHLVTLQRPNKGHWLSRSFDMIERMHTEGDDFVRELATIGYLEGVQIASGRAGVDPRVFEKYLGSESVLRWHELENFWSQPDQTAVLTHSPKGIRYWLSNWSGRQSDR